MAVPHPNITPMPVDITILLSEGGAVKYKGIKAARQIMIIATARINRYLRFWLIAF